MVKKVSLICLICIIVGVILVNIPQKPKLISSITTMDRAYLTILVDKNEAKNIEKLKEKLLQMCKENRSLEKNVQISVYTSRRALKKGIPYVTIKNDAEN